MPYKTAFSELIYPSESMEPAVARFRVALTDPPLRLAVLHVVHVDPDGVSPVVNANARDRILNLLLDTQLAGQTLGSVRFVVEDITGRYEYTVHADTTDYVRRGNPYVARPVPGPRGTVTEEISIDSTNLIAGRMRVGTLHSAALPLGLEAQLALT